MANLTDYIPSTETQLHSHSTRTSTVSTTSLGGSGDGNSLFETDGHGAIKASRRAIEHFADVAPSICLELAELYAPDFDLFNYSLEGFN